MVSSSRKLPLFLSILGCFCVCIGDITDMTGEAICAAQCLANFSQSLDEPERNFLSQRPDLAEPHCLSKHSNCSLCLDVCRWSQQNTSSCEYLCFHLGNTVVEMLPNSPVEVHRQTCHNACLFSQIDRAERTAVVSGVQTASCPLSSSWPVAEACQIDNSCVVDTDCGHEGVFKCCLLEACLDGSFHSPAQSLPMSNQFNNKKGSRKMAPKGFCLRVSNDTVFEHKGVPPVPGSPSVRQTPMIPGMQKVYQLELDWSGYYNISRSSNSLEWNSLAVFLVQLRFFRDLDGSMFGDSGSFGDELLQDEIFSEWRSLVWTTKVGAVLSDLNPGTWYQFRLKAASGSGFGGNGRPSKPVKVMTLPDVPCNLTEGVSRMRATAVEVDIHWEPPAFGRSPPTFYRVSWRKNKPLQISSNSIVEHKTKVPGTALTFTLKDLEHDTVYRVQVTAVIVIDGQEWSSQPVIRFIKTVPLISSEYQYERPTHRYDKKSRSCLCSDSPENGHFIQSPFFEDGNLKVHVGIPRRSLKLYFGPDVHDSTIFQIIWYPHVCIETHNSKVGLYSAPSRINVYATTLSSTYLEDLRFQCHYKMAVRIVELFAVQTPIKDLELCFCTPSCTEVIVKSGPNPKNCSFVDALIPHQPIDVGYRLTPVIGTGPQNPMVPGVSAASSRTELEPTLPVRSVFNVDSNRQSGFDAIIFWKPHPEMIFPEHAVSGVAQAVYNSRLKFKGYRVTWGPRLVEPIEPDMYSNGIAPQLDPERRESKVVDARVHNVILQNLEPATLYIVQVQTIGTHGDSPVNTVFFTTPSLLRTFVDMDTGSCLQSCWVICASSVLLNILFQRTFVQ